MRRREFLGLVGGVAVWPPCVAHAQKSKPVIGFLSVTTRAETTLSAFRQGLAEAGFVEGKNIVIDYRFANGRHNLLPPLAADLVARRVDLIAAMAGSTSARAAQAATTKIPIVFVMGDADPVQAGIVRSLNRPEGNITGAVLMGGALGVKRVQLIRELMRNAKALAILENPRNQVSQREVKDVEAAVKSSGLRPVVVQASEVDQFDAAFETAVREHADGLIVAADVFFTQERFKIIALAARHSLPAVYQWRRFADAGGLMSYSASIAEANRQAGIYAGRILKGEKPANLPVVLPTKFELVINLRTAKALKLDVPLHIQQLADDVIE
jgi:putative ABC transport system substrate-binding protein